MPEQLTKHPDVTLQVLRSSGARCAEGAAQELLTQCPAARFCKFPGGELCVYGLADAPRMTQITAAEWREVATTVLGQVPRSEASLGGEGLVTGSIGLVAGAVIGYAISRVRRHRP